MTRPGDIRVLLLGERGMLGHDLRRAAPAGVSFVVPPPGRLDIREHALVSRVLGAERPDVVVNAAAYTAVDAAEDDEDNALAVNGTAVGELGSSCAALGIALCHFSTDYVFAGDSRRTYKEDALPGPLGAYGRSKLQGEQLLAASGAPALIIRTQWLFGCHGRSFPRTMWDRARSGQLTRVVDDQTGHPTYTMDLARATWRLIERRTRGIIHVTNSGAATWFDLADAVFTHAGTRALVAACATADYPTRARRPVNSRLDHSRADELLGGGLPHWRDALRRFLHELSGDVPSR
jgi:dTDP-4-dehydrorhamnose reductase